MPGTRHPKGRVPGPEGPGEPITSGPLCSSVTLASSHGSMDPGAGRRVHHIMAYVLAPEVQGPRSHSACSCHRSMEAPSACSCHRSMEAPSGCGERALPAALLPTSGMGRTPSGDHLLDQRRGPDDPSFDARPGIRSPTPVSLGTCAWQFCWHPALFSMLLSRRPRKA